MKHFPFTSLCAFAVLLAGNFHAARAAAPKPVTSSSSKQELRNSLKASLAECARLVDQHKYREFLERYAPIEDLREIRRQNLVDRVASSLKTNQRGRERFVNLFKNLKTGELKIHPSGGLATITVDNFKGIGIDPPRVPDPETEKVPEFGGYGKDLNTVLKKALASLDEKDFKTFTESLYPPSELVAATDKQTAAEMRQLLTKHADMARQMSLDLKALAELTPKYEDGGKVAVYRFGEDKAIKFQLHEGNWRFYDDSKAIRKEIVKQSQNPPRPDTRTIEFELVNGGWRFIKLD